MVGEDLLRDTFKSLQALKRQNSQKGNSGPYTVDFYNICPLMYQKNGNVVARFINNLVEGLNEFHCIPRMLLIIPDNSIIKGIKHDEYGVSKILGSCLDHIIKEFELTLDRKKELMELIKPGSISFGEPKTIWVKLFDNPRKDKVWLKQRDKFNATLEESLASQKHSYIMDINNVLDSGCFDRHGYLTPRGKTVMWSEIDKQIKDFDKQIISLKPSQVITKANEAKALKSKIVKKLDFEPRRLLPVPPPVRQYKKERPYQKYRNSGPVYYDSHRSSQR